MKQAIENSRNIFNNEYISNNKILPLIVKINPNFKGVDNPKLVTNVLAQHYNLNLEKITNEYEIYLKTNILSETGTPTLYKLYIQENGVIS